MKIYDCFPFYKELDLLELRFEELYDHVDHFVLVEAIETHSGNPKPFYFEDNKDRYAKYLDKVIHIKVDDMPHSADSWVNEGHHRDQIMKGIVDASPEDLILISDLDEIFRSEAVEHMRNSTSDVFAIRMTLHNFKFNYLKVQPDLYSIWGMATRKKLVDANFSPTEFRRMRFQFMNHPFQYANYGVEVVEHGGWQFSNMGDNQWLQDKVKNFAHQEINNDQFLSNIDIDASIEARASWDRTLDDHIYEIVELDDYFPKTVLNNKEKYKQWILDNPVEKILDLLPTYPYNT